MPSMSNITVKAADGTTDVVYTAINPSAGDKSPALWQNEQVGNILAARPNFEMVSLPNGGANARRLRTSFVYPKVRKDAGNNDVIRGAATGQSTHLIPMDMTETEIGEYVAQYTGLLYSELVRACIRVGRAAG